VNLFVVGLTALMELLLLCVYLIKHPELGSEDLRV
jgi:hypothetical protein